MSTCKTFEKEMLLPHILGGERCEKWWTEEQTKRFLKKKKCINKHNSHFEMTRRNKTEMTAQQITSFHDTLSVYFTNQVWYPKHCTSQVSLDKTIKSPLNVNISTRGKGGTLLKSSTNTKSSISHYRRLITGWRSSTFGICFIFIFFPKISPLSRHVITHSKWHSLATIVTSLKKAPPNSTACDIINNIRGVFVRLPFSSWISE